jgi:hypothetical protein
MGGQPPLDDLGMVDDDVVADHHDHGCGRVGGQELLVEGTEAGAYGLAKDLVEEAASVQADGAKDGPPPVGPRGHDFLAGSTGDPGGPHPGEQVEVGLVFGQDDRAVGQVPELLVQLGEGLVAVRVALADRPGPPPGGDLADPPAQGALADGWSASPSVPWVL